MLFDRRTSHAVADKPKLKVKMQSVSDDDVWKTLLDDVCVIYCQALIVLAPVQRRPQVIWIHCG